jgi:hypothetical protein
MSGSRPPAAGLASMFWALKRLAGAWPRRAAIALRTALTGLQAGKIGMRLGRRQAGTRPGRESPVLRCSRAGGMPVAPAVLPFK